MIKYYIGHFLEEQFLFETNKGKFPEKGEFIYYNGEVYTVMYTMINYDHNEFYAFVRLASEEEY